MALGIDESDCSKGNLDMYKHYFERPFLQETKRYYKKESDQFLAYNSVVEYMKKVCALATASCTCMLTNDTRLKLVSRKRRATSRCIFTMKSWRHS